MNHIDIRSVDLNLLKTFDMLERERSVTKAAKRLRLGQPALSHALGRLRELTGDELFVRGPTGMSPTPRALELIAPVRAGLAQIEAALFGQQDFEPTRAKDCFHLGMTDFVAAAVMPVLSRVLAETAPHVTLAVVSAERSNAAELLDQRRIDLAVGFFPECASWQRRAQLFEEDHVCVFNRKLVRAKTPISLDDYVRYPHVLVSLRGDEQGFVDGILRKWKRERRVAITTPYFLLAGYLLHQLPLIATLPTHYAQLCVVTSQLTISPVPFETPHFAVSMLWHGRDDTRASLTFLRTALERAFATPTKLPRRK
jgi:LysR family transcriptional activator of mexEF-oprN operon